MRLLRATVAAAFVAALFAACGGGTTKKQFLAKADPICKQGNDIVSVLTTPSDYPQIGDFATKVADTTANTLQRLRKLSMPGGQDGTAAKAWMAALDAGVQSARAVAATVPKTDYASTESTSTDMQGKFRTADDQARAYGSLECGKAQAVAATNLSQTAPATGKKHYIARVDPLCKANNDAQKQLEDPQSMAELKALVDKQLPQDEKLINDMKAVPQPYIDKGTLDAMFAALDQVLATEKQLQQAVNAGNERQVGQLGDQLVTQGSAAGAKGDAYGFKDCGSQS